MTGATNAGLQTAQAIREAAAQLFFDHGYEATSLRAVAAEVGIKVGSLYNHIDSKEDLLLQVMGSTMDDLMALQEVALARSEDPLDRLLAFVECHIRFHAEHAQAVFIGNTELRSLSEDARAEIVSKRRDYQKLIESLILATGEQGDAQVLDPRLHAFGIVAQGTHVASWYKPSGQYSLKEIVRVYSKIILRGLGVKDADAKVHQHLNGVESTVAS
ncbi:MAG: TetR/AcrR family transcriptional regulator [Leucobacter sp.]